MYSVRILIENRLMHIPLGNIYLYILNQPNYSKIKQLLAFFRGDTKNQSRNIDSAFTMYLYCYLNTKYVPNLLIMKIS